MATEADREALLARLLLKADVEDFFAHEAELLDARRFEDWLELMAPDVKVWMPIARNVADADLERELTAEGVDANWLDEGLDTLRQRVKQLATGVHWAEQPPSRTTHMTANIRILETTAGPDGDVAEIRTRCNFMLYRNRLEDEQDFFIGKRVDVLRRTEDGWRLARREIYLDQNVMLAKNLSVFF